MQPLSWVTETEEEQLAQVMNEIGPFAALVDPEKYFRKLVPQECISVNMSGKAKS